MVGGDVADGEALFAIVDQRKHAIVGSYKQVTVAGQNDRAPRRSYSGIDDHHVHRAGREVGIGLRDGERAVQDVERLHGMADVDDLRVGRDLQDHALHGADEMIVESEIGGESDDRGACQSRYLVDAWKFSGQTKYQVRRRRLVKAVAQDCLCVSLLSAGMRGATSRQSTATSPEPVCTEIVGPPPRTLPTTLLRDSWMRP